MHAAICHGCGQQPGTRMQFAMGCVSFTKWEAHVTQSGGPVAKEALWNALTCRLLAEARLRSQRPINQCWCKGPGGVCCGATTKTHWAGSEMDRSAARCMLATPAHPLLHMSALELTMWRWSASVSARLLPASASVRSMAWHTVELACGDGRSNNVLAASWRNA